MLWESSDHTASEIGVILGTTKNAVIGMAHRKEMTPRRLSTPAAAAAPKGPYPYELVPAGGCVWPFGHPDEDGFRFCAEPARGRSYCDKHRAAAYQRPLSSEGSRT